MSKVEELRESIIAMAIEPTARKEVTSKLAFLIAAVREEAIGWEKERIRASGELLVKGKPATSGDCFDDILQRATGEFITVATYDCYVIPASVLAPKEEK